MNYTGNELILKQIMKKHQGWKQVKEETLQFLGMTWRCNKHGCPQPHRYGLRVTNITGNVKAKCPAGNLDMQGGRCLSPTYQQRCKHQPTRALKCELKALGLLTIPQLCGGEQEDTQTAASCFTVVQEGTHDSTSLHADLVHG